MWAALVESTSRLAAAFKRTSTPPVISRGRWSLSTYRAMLPNGATPYQVDDRQQDHRADERDHQSGQVQSTVIDSWATQQEAADHRADDTDDNVQERALLGICPHDDTCQPTNQCAEYQPNNQVNH